MPDILDKRIGEGRHTVKDRNKAFDGKGKHNGSLEFELQNNIRKTERSIGSNMESFIDNSL